MENILFFFKNKLLEIQGYFITTIRYIRKYVFYILALFIFYVIIYSIILGFFQDLFINLPVKSFYNLFFDYILAFALIAGTEAGKASTCIFMMGHGSSLGAAIPLFYTFIILFCLIFFLLPGALLGGYLRDVFTPLITSLTYYVFLPVAALIMEPLIYLFSKRVEKEQSGEKKEKESPGLSSDVKNTFFFIKERIIFICFSFILLIALFFISMNAFMMIPVRIIMAFSIVVLQGIYYISIPYFKRGIPFPAVIIQYFKNFPRYLVFSLFMCIEFFIVYIFFINEILRPVVFIGYILIVLVKIIGITNAMELVRVQLEKKPVKKKKQIGSPIFKLIYLSLSVIIVFTLMQMILIISDKIQLLSCEIEYKEISVVDKPEKEEEAGLGTFLSELGDMFLEQEESDQTEEGEGDTGIGTFLKELGDVIDDVSGGTTETEDTTGAEDSPDIVDDLADLGTVFLREDRVNLEGKLLFHNPDLKDIYVENIRFTLYDDSVVLFETNIDNTLIGGKGSAEFSFNATVNSDYLRDKIFSEELPGLTEEGKEFHLKAFIWIELDLWFGKVPFPIPLGSF